MSKNLRNRAGMSTLKGYKRKRYSEDQILGFLKEALESNVPVSALCRKHGFSDASFYNWRTKYGPMLVEKERANGSLALEFSPEEIDWTRHDDMEETASVRTIPTDQLTPEQLIVRTRSQGYSCGQWAMFEAFINDIRKAHPKYLKRWVNKHYPPKVEEALGPEQQEILRLCAVLARTGIAT